jgi:hypothetical protein
MDAVDDFTVESSGAPMAGILPDVPAVDDPTPAEPTVTEPEAQPEASVEATDDTPADDAPRDEHGRFAKKDKPRDNPVARIGQLTREKHDAVRRAEELAAKLAEYERQQTAPPRPVSTEPVPGLRPMPREDEIGQKYQSYGDYSLDLARWVREEERATERAEQSRVQTERQTREQSVRAAKYQTEMRRAFTERPDLKAAVDAVAHIPITPAIEQALLASDHPVELVDYLATHPEEFLQLAEESADALHPVEAAKWMRRYLESKATAAATPGSAPKPAISAAKAPIKPVGSSPTPADPLAVTDDLPIEEHIRRMNALDRKKKQGL